MTTYKGIKGFTVQTLSSDPTTPASIGQIYYNSTSNVFKYVSPGGVSSGTWSSGGNLNTAREECGGAGIQTASLVFGGLLNPPGSPRRRAETESYNGTSWTEVADLAQLRSGVMGTGLYNAALAIGGYDGSSNYGNTEIFNGSSWSESGDLNTASGFGCATGVQTAALRIGSASGSNNQVESFNGSSWSELTEINEGRYNGGASGTTTSALFFGGRPPNSNGNTESWNGSAWTEVNNLNTGRYNVTGTGTTIAEALAIGGYIPGGGNELGNTESFDGTSWTEVNDLATARRLTSGGSNSPNSVSIVFGGYDGSSVSSATEEWTAPDLAIKTITTS